MGGWHTCIRRGPVKVCKGVVFGPRIAPVAQWLEHPTHNRQVVGSSPTRRTPVAYVSERGATLVRG